RRFATRTSESSGPPGTGRNTRCRCYSLLPHRNIRVAGRGGLRSIPLGRGIALAGEGHGLEPGRVERHRPEIRPHRPVRDVDAPDDLSPRGRGHDPAVVTRCDGDGTTRTARGTTP